MKFHRRKLLKLRAEECYKESISRSLKKSEKVAFKFIPKKFRFIMAEWLRAI